MDFATFVWIALAIDVILIGYGQAQRFGNIKHFITFSSFIELIFKSV